MFAKLWSIVQDDLQDDEDSAFGAIDRRYEENQVDKENHMGDRLGVFMDKCEELMNRLSTQEKQLMLMAKRVRNEPKRQHKILLRIVDLRKKKELAKNRLNVAEKQLANLDDVSMAREFNNVMTDSTHVIKESIRDDTDDVAEDFAELKERTDEIEESTHNMWNVVEEKYADEGMLASLLSELNLSDDFELDTKFLRAEDFTKHKTIAPTAAADYSEDFEDPSGFSDEDSSLDDSYRMSRGTHVRKKINKRSGRK